MFSRSLALAGCAALCAIGQSNFATLRGTIQDSSTAAVHGANVTIRAKETGAVRAVRSNEHGLYEAVSLLPGAYVVETIATGFEPSAREVRLEVGQSMTLDVVLGVTGQRESVVVTAVAETLKAQDS